MRAYKGKFVKKNGEIREMLFARFEDIEQDNPEFIAAKIVGTGKSRTYEPDMELVWDLVQDDFRIFNFGTALEVDEIELEDGLFQE